MLLKFIKNHDVGEKQKHNYKNKSIYMEHVFCYLFVVLPECSKNKPVGPPFPLPPKKKGRCNQVPFSPQATKLNATVALFRFFVDQKIATYLCANLLQSNSVTL